ncbi:hypothetical protein ACWEV3_28730 [Saccharopolyspora sp. NPDC003752]|uniref:hypothetical protein n=1 Tax=Saccharopolyspora shandongensis TaxID=418495 RepID=UPI0033D33DED
MTTKRKQRVAPPAGPDHWEVRCGSNDAGKGWDELCQQAPGNTRRAWEQMSADPAPAVETPRQHRLRGSLGSGAFEGRMLPRWQIEVTGGGRIWYLVDAQQRTVWIVVAGNAHPKATE